MQLHPRRPFLHAICHRNRGKLCPHVIINIQERLTSNTPAMPVLRLLTTGFSMSTKYNFPLSCDVKCIPESESHLSCSYKSLTSNWKRKSLSRPYPYWGKALKWSQKFQMQQEPPNTRSCSSYRQKKAELRTLPKPFYITSVIFQLYLIFGVL